MIPTKMLSEYPARCLGLPVIATIAQIPCCGSNLLAMYHDTSWWDIASFLFSYLVIDTSISIQTCIRNQLDYYKGRGTVKSIVVGEIIPASSKTVLRNALMWVDVLLLPLTTLKHINLANRENHQKTHAVGLLYWPDNCPEKRGRAFLAQELVVHCTTQPQRFRRWKKKVPQSLGQLFIGWLTWHQ